MQSTVNSNWRFVFAAAALIALHAVVVASRLDESLLSDPDSADFLIGAKSLAQGYGYRDLSSPEQPIYARPIGMSALLAPVVAWRGYDIAACKTVVMACGLALLAASWQLARSIGTERQALVVLAVLALSPVMVLMHSHIANQAPFTLLLVLFILLLARRSNQVVRGVDHSSDDSAAPLIGDVQRPTARTIGPVLILAGLALAAEKTRLEGVVVWASLVVWAGLQSDRKRLLSIVAGAAVFSYLLEFFPGMPRSLGSFLSYSRAVGGEAAFAESMAAAGSAAWFYLRCAASCWMPAFWPELGALAPQTAIVRYDALAATIGLIVIALFIAGLTTRISQGGRRSEAAAVAVCAIGITAILLCWPHRSARLFYPLIPVVTIYGAIGAGRLLSNQLHRLGGWTVCVAQWLCLAAFLTSDNPMKRFGDDAQAIGRWIDETLPSDDRIATDRKGLFLWSNRLQGYIRPQQLSLDAFNRELGSLGPGYAWFANWEGDRRLLGNPAFEFRPIDVVSSARPIWKVGPNRAGTVPTDLKPLMERTYGVPADRKVSQLWPAQRALFESYLLELEGDTAGALELLERFEMGVAASDPFAADVWMKLGNFEIANLTPDRAVPWFEKSRRASYSDAYQQSIEASINAARSVQHALDPAAPATARAAIWEAVARNVAASGRWNDSLRFLEMARDVDRTWISGRLFRAKVLRRLGRTVDAAAELDEIERIMRESRQGLAQSFIGWQRELADERLLQMATSRLPSIPDSPPDQSQSIDLSSADECLEICARLESDGAWGVELLLLERCSLKHPANRELRFRLDLIRRRFGKFDAATESARR